MSDKFAGPGIIFFQALTLILVLGALGLIVDVVRRPASRWRWAVTRWLWLVVPVVFIVSLVAGFLWRGQNTFTVLGISFVAVLVTEVSYLLRVVFPAPGRITQPDSCPEPPSHAEKVE